MYNNFTKPVQGPRRWIMSMRMTKYPRLWWSHDLSCAIKDTCYEMLCFYCNKCEFVAYCCVITHAIKRVKVQYTRMIGDNCHQTSYQIPNYIASRYFTHFIGSKINMTHSKTVNYHWHKKWSVGKKSDRKMLKAGNLASREDHRVRGVKSGRTRPDRGISHVCRSEKHNWTPVLYWHELEGNTCMYKNKIEKNLFFFFQF